MGSEVQSLLFARSKWGIEDARDWALDHGFEAEAVHVTDRYFRIRQFHPDPSMRYRTIEFGHGRGIKAVIAWPEDEG